MRASVFIGTSLDGFIARPNGDLDWLPTGSDDDHGYGAFMATVDALLMGRNTYDTVLGFGGWPYGRTPVYVLSTRALPPAPEGATVERLWGTPDEVVAALEARGVTHAYVDGGVVIQEFLRAGRIQRLVLTRIPVLIGSGIPLFGPLEADIRLRHVATRAFPSGLVQSEYAIDG